MRRSPNVVLGLLLTITSAGRAQTPLDSAFEAAYQAWDRGDYVSALEGFVWLLRSQRPERYFDMIARLTGELHPTVELTPDGRAVRFSPDGRWLAYESDEGGATVTHIVPVDGGFQKAAGDRVAGVGLVFAPSGDRVAYLRLPRSRALERARSDAERAVARGDREEVMRLRAEVRYLEARGARIVIRELASGRERTIDDGGLVKERLAWGADGRTLYVVAAREGQADRSDIYAIVDGGTPRAVTDGPGFKGGPIVAPGGRYLVYEILPRSPVPQRPGAVAAAQPPGQTAGPTAGQATGPRAGQAAGQGGGQSAGQPQVVVRDLSTGAERAFDGRSPRLSADGSKVVFLATQGRETLVQVVSLDGGDPVTVVRTALPVAGPALSPDGSTVAYQMMPREDWEIFLVDSDGSNPRRLTRDIQHDLFPRFIDDTTLLVVKGEARHRRSYLYDVRTGREARLFHNNTVRTIAPEYEWDVSADGTKVAFVAERDGDTVSPERGVYLMDLSRKISREELLARIEENLAAERALREAGRAMFAPIEDEVRRVVARVSKTMLYGYQHALFQFDSKYITEPGNRKAIEYLAETLRSWGYEPELQWFEPRPGVRTANVIARLPGTRHPELIYVVGSHFDSSPRGPGADDNTSGTSMLLETARVLKDHPLPATVVFAFFTGEEAGLLGSREFARRAEAEGWARNVRGALNNDMMGYANDHRLDNTIRYSNAGIRDLQHAAAFLFSRLITYDARYYKNTDAHALFDAFGDVIGGIGSYPVLANPHYHQSHDVLETINHELVLETTKANVASIMLLASSPSRIDGLRVVRRDRSGVEVAWEPAREKGIRHYRIVYGPPVDPMREELIVTEPRARIPGARAGWTIAVKAVDERGLSSWDWARIEVR